MIQAIEPYLKDGECVWIDTFCHNQHDIGSVVPQMERVIADIDRLVLPMSEPPWYQRSWCIWEVLCALRANKDIVLVEYAKKARDMYQIRDFDLADSSRLRSRRPRLPKTRRSFSGALRRCSAQSPPQTNISGR